MHLSLSLYAISKSWQVTNLEIVDTSPSRGRRGRERTARRAAEVPAASCS